MRMASALSTLLAVLCGAVAGAGDASSDASRMRVRRATQPHHSHRLPMDEENGTATWKRAHWKEMQGLLKDGSVECCPSVRQMVAPIGGKTPNGLYVKLYNDGANTQQFYEQSCDRDVVDKPCRFVDPRLYNRSRCVQKYSYSYALVTNATASEITHHRHKRDSLELPASGGWSLDYILVRAGCECEIMPEYHKEVATLKKKPHKKRLEKHRLRRRNRLRPEEDEET